MSQSKRLALLAGAALSLGGVANAAPQTQSSDEVRAIVAEMLADAQTRSSLLQGGGSDPFTLSSSDGASTLKIGGQLQFRYYLNMQDDANTDEFDSGFETRRTKINLSGQIHENWKYNVQGNFSSSTGAFGLEDAWVGYDLGDGMSVSWGQGKLPGTREEMVSSKYQLAIERSTVNEVFTLGRAQGIALHYNQDDWRGAVAFSDGVAYGAPGTAPIASDPGANNAFTSATEGDWGFSARGEYKMDGEWSQFKDFTSGQGDAFGAMLGAGLHYGASSNTGSNTATNTTDTTHLQYTVDLSLEGDSWNAFAAFVGRSTSARAAGADTDTDDYGIVVQGGFRVQEDTEIFARYDGLFFDTAGVDDASFITVGVNKYYAGHAAKASLDVVFALDQVTAALTDPGAGMRTDAATTDGQVAVRLQFQLLF